MLNWKKRRKLSCLSKKKILFENLVRFSTYDFGPGYDISHYCGFRDFFLKKYSRVSYMNMEPIVLPQYWFSTFQMIPIFLIFTPKIDDTNLKKLKKRKIPPKKCEKEYTSKETNSSESPSNKHTTAFHIHKCSIKKIE